jgi:transcriptional regulator with XRE-family HTH domain
MPRLATPKSARLDAYVGARIRARRKMLGQTQAQLAEALDVSFQQLQKYERGANRLSVALLHEIAQAQGSDVGWYVEGFGDGAAQPPASLMTTRAAPPRQRRTPTEQPPPLEALSASAD